MSLSMLLGHNKLPRPWILAGTAIDSSGPIGSSCGFDSGRLECCPTCTQRLQRPCYGFQHCTCAKHIHGTETGRQKLFKHWRYQHCHSHICSKSLPTALQSSGSFPCLRLLPIADSRLPSQRLHKLPCTQASECFPTRLAAWSSQARLGMLPLCSCHSHG